MFLKHLTPLMFILGIALIALASPIMPVHIVHGDMTQAPPQDLVVQWNEAMLGAVRDGKPRPTVISRANFMVHTAMYDAWSLYDEAAAPVHLNALSRRPAIEHTAAHKAEAVSQAAYQMLTAFYPEYEQSTGAFSALMIRFGYEIVSEGDLMTATGIGYSAAEAVLAGRATDGSNPEWGYAEFASELYPTFYRSANSANPDAINSAGNAGYDLNRWQPLRVPTGDMVDQLNVPMVDHSVATTYNDQLFLTPHWGSVEPFALDRGDQLRPQAPPQAGSDEPYTDGKGQVMTNDEAFHIQLDEVLILSGELTDEQKVIAEYWADGPRSETPPGHWNALAHGISYRDNHTIDQDVKLYFALNGALFDGGIAAWDAKRVYDYVRPVCAIQNKYEGEMVSAWGGPDQGTQMILGNTWRPYQDLTFVTPPFPEYISGHSTFSAAAAEVLTQFTGSNQYFDGVTVLEEDFNGDGVGDVLGQHVVYPGGNMFENSPVDTVTLRWPTFQDAADEAGVSRLYGGIHFQDADLFGREVGLAVGTEAYERAEQYWSGAVSPTIEQIPSAITLNTVSTTHTNDRRWLSNLVCSLPLIEQIAWCE